MVDQLVNDERLLMPVRMQLRALEPALLQLARSDPRFFIDRRHSARQLLDRVVQRSLAYPADDEEAIADFAACVSDAVNGLDPQRRRCGRLCRHPGADSSGPGTTSDEARRERRASTSVWRANMFRQRLVLAQRFSDAMMERFRNGNLPELVASFLRGPWSQVLAESHLLNTGAQADPRGYLALVDDLVWSVQLSQIRQDHAASGAPDTAVAGAPARRPGADPLSARTDHDLSRRTQRAARPRAGRAPACPGQCACGGAGGAGCAAGADGAAPCACCHRCRCAANAVGRTAPECGHRR